MPASATAAKPAARDPAAILSGAVATVPATAASAAKPAKAGADPFTYYVQAGAFQRSEDAEQQRAKLGMLGVETKIVEREQSGRTVLRVRAGPFDKQADADATKERLVSSGIDAVLVRVERTAQ